MVWESHEEKLFCHIYRIKWFKSKLISIFSREAPVFLKELLKNIRNKKKNDWIFSHFLKFSTFCNKKTAVGMTTSDTT